MLTVPKMTETVVKNFEKIVSGAATTNVGRTEMVLRAIRKAKASVPANLSDDNLRAFVRARREALKKLSGDYFIARMTSSYGLIDEALFNLTRRIVVDGKKVTYDTTGPVEKSSGKTLEIPLFPWVELDDEREIVLGKWTERRNIDQGGWSKTRSKTTEVKTKVPTVPDEVRLKGAKAIAVYHGILAEMYSKEELHDIVDKREGAEYGPSLAVTWIPSPDTMTIKITETEKTWPRHPDPALLLIADGRTFLVDTWVDDGEEPFDHFLREFTSGVYPKKE